jgi:hypothetical protein
MGATRTAFALCCAFAAVLLGTTGCGSSSAVAAAADVAPSPVVVADLSTGTNPYHEVFRRPSWTAHPSTVIPGFPADAPALPLTLGPDLQADLKADADLWKNMKTGVVYWIPGTNLLYVHTRYKDQAFPSAPHDAPAYATGDHGSESSGVMAQTCRTCYVLIVSDPEAGFTYALDYITKNLPWVDVASSTQFTVYVSPASSVVVVNDVLISPLTGPVSEYALAAKQLADSGRLYFIASGDSPTSLINYPLPTPTTANGLPPWFTLVGGAYPECHDAELMSGSPTEFVSDYNAQTPAPDATSGFTTQAGTSYSTPKVAALFGETLGIVRRSLGDRRAAGVYWAGPAQNSAFLADGELSREDLYSAFAAAGELFSTAQASVPCQGAIGYPIPVTPTPWLQMGWGYVGQDQAELAASLILGRAAAPSKPADQAAYMRAYMSARVIYATPAGP